MPGRQHHLGDDPTQSEVRRPESEVYGRLVETVVKGALLFVGAGSSRRVGYPTWQMFLSQLSDAAKRARPSEAANIDRVQGADGPVRASVYRKILGGAGYTGELLRAFGPKTPQHDEFQEMLVGLPFKHVLTTNFDCVLQSAHATVAGTPAESFDVDEWDRLSEFRQGHAAAGGRRQYVHVHGSIGRPEGIVLCKEDYDSRYVNENRAKLFLREVLTGHRVVFVGFSLADADLMYILREVAGSLGLSYPRHFAVLPRPPAALEDAQRTDLIEQYRVEPVYFDSSSEDYASLVALVRTLRHDVCRREETAPASYVPVDAISTFLADLLLDQPQILSDLRQRLPEFVRRHAAGLRFPNTGAGGISDIDAAIDAVFKLVENGLPDEAITEYEAIRVKHASTLTAKQEYRVEANIGNALYSKGNFDEAADAYLRAVSLYRDSRDAQALEVFAHFLRADMSATLRLATSLCDREPSFSRARSLWVRAHPDTSEFERVEERVPEDLRRSAEVALALSDLARRTKAPEAQERYARAAVADSPSWVDALAALGTSILQAERSGASLEMDRGLVPPNSTRVAEAEELFCRAIKHTPPTDPMARLAGYHFNRSIARRLRGDIIGAGADRAEAFRRDPADPVIALAYAMEAESPAEITLALKAVDSLPSGLAESDQLEFARVCLLRRRRQAGDTEQALVKIIALARRLGEVTPPTLRGDVVLLSLRLLSELDRAAEGPAFVSALPVAGLSPLVVEVHRGRAEFLAGNRDKAAEHAGRAGVLLDSSTSWFDRRETALLAQDCRLYAEAVTAWESLLAPGAVDSDTVHLVRCAYFAGLGRKVLEVCERVRAAGGTQRAHLVPEVEVLANSREPERALALLQQWIREHPSDKHARLHLSCLALQHGREELASFDERELPSVSEVDHAGEGSALVYVLRRGPVPQRALDVAYELYRRFPEQGVAHQTLVGCVFDRSVSQLEIHRPSVVGKSTAACIRREGEAFRWIYVEDGPEPAATRGEYPEAHALVVAVWGKRAGDRFEFQGHRYEVVGVENRALRRVHDIMDKFEENFPEGPLLRRLSLPENPPADAPIEEQLGEMMTELQRHEKHRELLESLYRGAQLPLTIFARYLGRPLFNVVRAFASQPRFGIRADGGDRRHWEVAVASVGSAQAVVLDSTALAGALVLGLLDELPKWGLKLVVPRAVLDEIREISLDAANPRNSGSTIGLHDGRVFFHESSPEELAREVETVERVLRFIREHCEVAGGDATLDLPPALRDQMERSIGAAATDAIALTKKRNGVLWTDDHGLQVLASRQDLKIQCVWTQVLLFASREAHRISDAEYTRGVGRLVECGYGFMRLSPRDVVDLLREAGWRSDTRLGRAVVQTIQEVALRDPHNRTVTAVAIVLLWCECPHRTAARDLIVAILDGIGRKRSGPALAAFIYRAHSNQIFRAADVRALRQMLRSWRSQDGEFRP